MQTKIDKLSWYEWKSMEDERYNLTYEKIIKGKLDGVWKETFWMCW